MTTKIAAYRAQLQDMADWDEFLRAESNLPGPRANLELAQAAADVGTRARFEHLLALDKSQPGGAAAANTPDEFLTVCGVWGLGKLIAGGDDRWYADLRGHAADPRWRVREAAAIALQQVGDADLPAVVDHLGDWRASWYERRAAVAALAEPRLCRAALQQPPLPARIIALFDAITRDLVNAPVDERRDSGYPVLRQALGYAWSVIVAELPMARTSLEAWLIAAVEGNDRDLCWVVRENLKKNRLVRLDPQWVATWKDRLA